MPDGKIEDETLRNEVESDIKALGVSSFPLDPFAKHRSSPSRIQDIAKQLRARRFDNGALRIDNVKVSFSLNEFGLPEDCRAYERKEANELIEEVS